MSQCESLIPDRESLIRKSLIANQSLIANRRDSGLIRSAISDLRFRVDGLILLALGADRAVMEPCLENPTHLHQARLRRNLGLGELSARTSLSPAVVRNID